MILPSCWSRSQHRANRDCSTAPLRRSLSFSISLSLLNRVWLSQHRADRNLTFTSIAIAAPCRSQSQHCAAWSCLSSNPIASLSSFFSQFDRIMNFFFWVLFVFLDWGMKSYICLVVEKMWATSRKCVFYGIFKNTTKHQKIFFKTFYEMQSNT